MPVINASPDVKVAEPRISKLAVFILSFLVNPYMLMLFGPAKIKLADEKILFDVFQRTLSRKSRCLIAFRHPDGREPQLLTWFFLFRVKPLAAQSRIRFARRPHAIFVYGYEVARWGGWIARAVMPKIGAIPIHHSKLDSKGMARIYDSIVNGQYPLALAPEGQVSYTTDTVPRLETGTIRIGFQAAEQLKENGKNCPLEILPISIHFRYGNPGKAAMEKLLRRIEKTCGFRIKETSRYLFEDRLKKCLTYLLEINEGRYNIKIYDSISLEERVEKVVNTALETAERMLGIKGEGGDFFQRLYRVRHICWDMIFIPEINNFDKIAQVRRSVMDLKAGEAYYIARHQELADFGWYFRKPVPDRDAAVHLKAEYVQNLWDFANRTMGGAISGRINIPPRKIIIKPAPVIDLSARLSHYKNDKRGAVNEAIADLEKAYVKCIEEVNNTEN